MPLIDKKFFLAHYDEIKAIFDRGGVQKAVIHFAGTDSILYLDFKENQKPGEQRIKIKNDLMILCNKYQVAYLLHISNFYIFGQEVPIPQEAINFEDLLKNAQNPALCDTPTPFWSPEVASSSNATDDDIITTKQRLSHSNDEVHDQAAKTIENLEPALKKTHT